MKNFFPIFGESKLFQIGFLYIILRPDLKFNKTENFAFSTNISRRNLRKQMLTGKSS